MHQHPRTSLFAIAVAVVVAGWLLPAVADAQPPRTPLALEPAGSTGEAVWPAYEAWSRNADESLTLLVGYYNRNEVAVDILIGPDNNIGRGEDMGQPTHFLPGRNWGVFSITVPADEAERRLNWTLRINNQLAEVQFWANPPYFADPFLNVANGNVPPILKVGPTGQELQGPPHGVVASYATTVGEPLTLLLTVRDQPLVVEPEQRAGRRRRPPLGATWKKYRGPGQVTFEADGIDAGPVLTHRFDDLAGGETMTSVTFDAPGQYRLMATGNDISGNGGGGDQCCWTTAHVDVTVNP
jgi:hypothetical protein